MSDATTNESAPWTEDAVRDALTDVVKGPWKVMLSWRRGTKPGAERPEHVVGASARIDGTADAKVVGKVAVSWETWVDSAQTEGYRLRGVCSLGAEAAVLSIDTATRPTPEVFALLARLLVRTASLGDGGAAWKAWRKESR